MDCLDCMLSNNIGFKKYFNLFMVWSEISSQDDRCTIPAVTWFQKKMGALDGDFDVRGKVFVITGGDKGLGFETAKKLVREQIEENILLNFFSRLIYIVFF